MARFRYSCADCPKAGIVGDYADLKAALPVALRQHGWGRASKPREYVTQTVLEPTTLCVDAYGYTDRHRITLQRH